MPSLPFLRHAHKSKPPGSNKLVKQARPDSAVGLDETPVEIKKQLSRRRYISRLHRHLFRARLHRQSHQSLRVVVQTESGTIPQPFSPSDQNKPLPPPPSVEDVPVAVTPIKLGRILSPLTVDDVHHLFSGAPHFFEESETGSWGEPRVSFPWNNEIDPHELTDHISITDKAWLGATVHRQTSAPGVESDQEPQQMVPLFVPRRGEKPDMLSMQGWERGTMGFRAALELGAADALQADQSWSTDPRSRATSENRVNLMHSDSARIVRPMAEEELVKHLRRIEIRYQDLPAAAEPDVDCYVQLFTQLLFAPSRVKDQNDPYSIHVQISSLVEALSAPNIWFDFSLVEWRIRLGQILWGPQDVLEADVDEVLIYGEQMKESVGQRFWLLLQILLSCELLLRLDTLVERSSDRNERHEALVDRGIPKSVEWSLLVARGWLDNIRIESADEAKINDEPTRGWQIFPASIPQHNTVSTLDKTTFMGRHMERQARGLAHFAAALDWPPSTPVASRLPVPEHGLMSDTPTPASTKTSSSSYFSRSVELRGSRKRAMRMAAVVSPSGWLSQSFLSGLILPGEGVSHLLMSTLLENDTVAMQVLGEAANLYGGFSYKEKSFWSTSCVVGRVLAAAKGSRECMGWISTDITPKGISNGWFNLDIDLTNFIRPPDNSKAVAGTENGLDHDWTICSTADLSSLLPGDFVLIEDESPPESRIEVNFAALELFAEEESMPPTPGDELNMVPEAAAGGIETFSALMRFYFKCGDEGLVEKSFDISHDVYFVSGHPCVSTEHLHLLRTPISPQVGGGPTLDDSTVTFSKRYRGHPLHKSHEYTRYNLLTILAEPHGSSFLAVFKEDIHTQDGRVVIIDCTEIASAREAEAEKDNASATPRKHQFGSDAEMLARAWCAELGVNAVISRRGRNCIACSVREVKALGWKVVLRIG